MRVRGYEGYKGIRVGTAITFKYKENFSRVHSTLALLNNIFKTGLNIC